MKKAEAILLCRPPGFGTGMACYPVAHATGRDMSPFGLEWLHEATPVDVIARWAKNTNYAIIPRLSLAVRCQCRSKRNREMQACDCDRVATGTLGKFLFEVAAPCNQDHDMIDASYNKIAEEFERHVCEHFALLENDYGFSRRPRRLHELTEPRDAVVSVRYSTDAVSVQIAMSLIGASISVNFKNEQWIDGPCRHYPKWVTIDSIVAYRTQGEALTLLPELTSGRNKFWPERFLIDNMELALRTLASQVQLYASDIIRGDTSCFAEVVAHRVDSMEDR